MFGSKIQKFSNKFGSSSSGGGSSVTNNYYGS